MKLVPHENIVLSGSVSLPISKSVRARELVLDAINGRPVSVEYANDDLYVLSSALNVIQNNKGDDEIELDLHASGTALRFLTAFCAASPGKYILKGSDRLSNRPIVGLVDALNGMGADIKYIGNASLPLCICGRKLKGGKVIVDVSVSSQYVSALLLISPLVDGGIELICRGEFVSSKYIDLTRSVIEKYNAGLCKSCESDWSSAAVWYSLIALKRSGYIILKGLSLNSVQPDRLVVDVYKQFGVETEEMEDGIKVFVTSAAVDYLDINCNDFPDSVVYLVVTACLLGIKFRIEGLRSLKHKESDRITAVSNELLKCGYVLKSTDSFVLEWDGDVCSPELNINIYTYEDHRIAMAMSLFGLFFPVEISNPGVVEKSYPNFWDEYSKFINIERLWKKH